MDVSVTICDKLQQVFVEYVEVPQLQFFDRVVGFVASQRQVHSANCAEVRRDSSGAVLGLVGTPVVVQRQVLGFDSAENCGSTASAVL